MKNKLIAAVGTLALVFSMLPSSVSAYWTNGFEVFVNGASVGMVEKSDDVSEALDTVNSELTSAYTEEEAISPDIQLRAMLVKSDKLLSETELHDAVASESENMVEATRLTIDGEDSIFLKSSEKIEECLNLVIEAHAEAGATSNIIELVGFNDQLAPAASVMTPQEASEYLIKNELLTVFTTVLVKEEKAYDPGFIEVTDDTLYEGVRVTTEKAKMGKTVVTTEKSYVNGVFASEKVSEETVDFGTPKTVTIGTKPRDKNVGTGNFIMPTNARFSSGYGRRWGRMHYGLDLAGPVGTKVWASDFGTVTVAEYKKSFGNLVVIDHGNGFETYYAHNSEILVSVGDVVPQGYVIAKMGSTGRSTGSHCHFEIHYNGVAIDPMGYVG